MTLQRCKCVAIGDAGEIAILFQRLPPTLQLCAHPYESFGVLDFETASSHSAYMFCFEPFGSLQFGA